MDSEIEFAARVREHFAPSGLTAVFAIGATRRTYILDKNRRATDPGRIPDFSALGEYMAESYREFIRTFLSLGGQNLIVTALSFRSFFERGEDYARLVIPEMLRVIDERFLEFYRSEDIDPYFVGLESLLLQPEDSAVSQMAKRMVEFQRHEWTYQDGRRKLLWEVASMPLLALWQAFRSMPAEEQAQIDALIAAGHELEDLARLLHAKFSAKVYGVELPMPQLYIGTNMSGDLKWRSPMPLALSGGEYLRMFYTPYPTLFMTREVMRAIIEDLAFGKRFHSRKLDYEGRYTPELAEAEHARILALRDDVDSVLGLSRSVGEQT
jgi:hypothetical protein